MQKVILRNGFAILVWQNKKLKYPSNIIGIEQLFIEGLLCQAKQREDIGKQIMKKDRFSFILKILDEEGSVHVAQLAKKLNVSEVTIRSDLNILGMQGLLNRVHGGAKKAGDNLYKGNVQETVYRYAANKMAIAKAAYSLLEDGSTILVDDSSTCLYLIKQIKKNKEKSMYIYTNSVYVVIELLETKHVSIHILGGEISRNLGSTSGRAGMAELQEIHTDYCFLGANGVSADKGVSIIGYSQMKTKQAMMEAAGRSILLADSHKFGLDFTSVVAPVQKFDTVITDNFHPSKALAAVCSAGNVYIAK